MSRVFRLVLVAAVLAAAAGIMGCASDTPESAESGAEETQETTVAANAEAEEAPAWLEGSWSVEHTLMSVEPEAMRPAADQQSAQWEATAEGDTMLIANDEHEYTGVYAESGDTWTYDGTATFVDDEGTEWTSHIVVDGARNGENGFTASMWGEISSDADGVLYEATWNQIGTRVQ